MGRLLAWVALAAASVTLTACDRSSSKPAPEPTIAESRPEAPTGGSDWPNFLGPNRDNISTETGINKNWGGKPPKLLWKTAMGDDGYAGPCVAEGRVFIIDHAGGEDVVRAIDLKSGQDVWTFRYKDADQSNNGFSRSTPAYDDGRLYIVSRLGNVACLDARSGKPIWSGNLVQAFGGNRPQWDYSASPLIDGKKLILVPGGPGAAVVAVDKTTGRTLWKGGGSDQPGYATPVKAKIDGRDQYVVFLAKGVVGVDAANGSLLWRQAWETSYDVNAATPLVTPSGVFITSDYGRGCAMVKPGGGLRWENKQMQAHFSSPLLYRGKIYGTGEPGKLMCIDPADGRALWEQPGFEKGGITLVDGAIVALNGSNGECILCEASPSGYKELGRFTPLGGQSWTAPIVAQGRLIVRNKSALACYDLK